MTTLAEHHLRLGANLAPDGIPLDYGDPAAEFESASGAAILLDRSHEGRILLSGRDRLNLVNRMSTNDVAALAENDGCATIFTNANARILFRVVCLNRPEGSLLISEAGQGGALADFLRRNIFFGDQVAVREYTGATAQFAIHGPGARAIVASLAPAAADLALMDSIDLEAAGCRLTLARRKAIRGEHWLFICAAEQAATVHSLLLREASASGLIPAGSLTYNALRICSGRPAGLELSSDYIPLEVGLWDEISFSKGCYTGQEIIARMESRGRLAKTIVKLDLSDMVAAPAPIFADGRAVGRLTSSVAAPDGQIYALAVVRLSQARAGASLSIGEQGTEAIVKELAGCQPPYAARLVQEK